MIQTCAYLYSSNFTPQVKEARNQLQIFNRKSISRNTTLHQSYHLQAMLTGVKRRKANTRSKKVNSLKTAMKKTHSPNQEKMRRPNFRRPTDIYRSIKSGLVLFLKIQLAALRGKKTMQDIIGNED